MITTSVEQFQALVADDLDGIRDELGANMENVAVKVDNASPLGRLFGL
jgi:predicted Zn-dependent protease with MMP-like domain